MADGARLNDDVCVCAMNMTWVWNNTNVAPDADCPSVMRRFERHSEQALTRCCRHPMKGDDEFGQIVIVSEKVGYGHVQHPPYPEQRASVGCVLASFVLIDSG